MALVPKQYSQYLGLGVEIAVSIGLPLGLGFFIDYYFDTSPWFTLAGILCGLLLFIATAIRIARRLNSKNGKS